MPPNRETYLPSELAPIRKYWQQIINSPKEYLVDMEGDICFVAGGVLPTVFGDESSVIWQKMLKALEVGDHIDIAAISFGQQDLELLGDFYRFIRFGGAKLHCIDERLEDDLVHKDAEVHCECGACAALQSALSKLWDTPETSISLEDALAAEVGKGDYQKQPIYEAMTGSHSSVTIFIDFSGDEAVLDQDKRTAMRQVGALPFQISLPVEKIQAYILQAELDDKQQDDLLQVLVSWNVQIARNIIGGHHNSLHHLAGYTIYVLDKRDVMESEDDAISSLIEKIKALIMQVSPTVSPDDIREIE